MLYLPWSGVGINGNHPTFLPHSELFSRAWLVNVKTSVVLASHTAVLEPFVEITRNLGQLDLFRKYLVTDNVRVETENAHYAAQPRYVTDWPVFLSGAVAS